MPHSIKKILTAAVSLVCVAAFTFLTVAWFSGFGYHGSVSFMPGSNPDLPATIVWMYYSEYDKAEDDQAAEAEDETNPRTEGWESEAVGEDPSDANEFLTIPAVNQSADGKNISYQLSSLHFGKVDNLVTLHNDNKIYLRFHITPAVLANNEGKIRSVVFTLSYNTVGYSYTQDSIFSSIHLYKEGEGQEDNKVSLITPVNQEAINATPEGQTPPEATYVLEYKNDNPAAMQFLQMRCGTSKQPYEPGTDDFNNNVKFSNVCPIHCGGASECSACTAGTCGKVTVETLNSLYLPSTDENGVFYNLDTDGFYVYLELAPLLDAFGMQENILDYFVPAYMLFDVKLDIEIK